MPRNPGDMDRQHVRGRCLRALRWAVPAPSDVPGPALSRLGGAP